MSKSKNTMYIYKKSPFKLMDMLKAKKLPGKVLNTINKKGSDADIRTNYYVNEIAKKLHTVQFEVVVKKIEDLENDVKCFYFYKKDNESMPFFRAGQYISVTCNINGVDISRPYSICSSPYDATRNNFIAIAIKKVENGLFSNFMHNKIKVGDTLKISSPEGDFYHSQIRDQKHVLAIAGGSGITPFMSMAKSIVEGSEDFNLTILYTNSYVKNILFLNELKELEQKSNGKVNVKFVITREETIDYINGRIDTDMIKQFITKDSSVFICGPKALNKYLFSQLLPLKIERRKIRVEASNNIGLPQDYENYKNKGNKNKYKIAVKLFNSKIIIDADANETILVSLQKARISAQTKCLSGQCSWCRFRLINGEVFTPATYDYRREGDKESNIYNSCSTFPISDLEIEAY